MGMPCSRPLLGTTPGRPHPYFQELLTQGLPADDPLRECGPWAKSAMLVTPPGESRDRPHFRHELALRSGDDPAGTSDLGGIPGGEHHGKVRLSIRSLAGEAVPPDGRR